MTTDVMISASGLSKQFGNTRALDNVSFEVRRGEVVGFLGPNGAGKSTTMRILTCYLSPSSGQASVGGYDVFEDPLAVRRAIGYLPQRAPLYQDMTVLEYLQFTADVRQLSASTFRERLKAIVEVCGLARSLGKTIGTLSHGFRQRVGLGQALIHDPSILILDEPTADLDPNEKAELLHYIQRIGEDRTVLLSTHNLAEAELACRRAIILSNGRVVADGPLKEIQNAGSSPSYRVVFDERGLDAAVTPTKEEVFAALRTVDTAAQVEAAAQVEGSSLAFQITASAERDLRRELFRLAVDRHWVLLELQRSTQSLDAVFRDLTLQDEARDRGRTSGKDEK